ncbi:translocator protein homolog [Impatiens glandulifera]|uniref:translocator protein homolog n=1 Tax=Impatiens glandulifera TaxID=253017 RepID=UPI001FB09E8D|nr:translocator protein homolog [Impatiens glandulifera]
MEDTQLRQRVSEEVINKAGNDVDEITKNKKQTKRAAMARRGLRSLAISVIIPVSLTFISRLIHIGQHKPANSLLAPWAMHTFFAISSLVMGLAAWLVWADGGFHRKPISLGLYLTHLVLTLAWDPAVFGFAADMIGLVVSVAMLAALTGCATTFRQLKPLAGDLALVSVLWGGVIVGLNLMHMYR